MTDEVNKKVSSILDSIKISNTKKCEPDKSPNKDAPTSATNKQKKEIKQIRGMPKSGRFWKSNKERFTSINKNKGLKQDFKKKTALRLELKRTKELSKQVKEELLQKEANRKERRKQNLLKAEENKRKSEIVQVISNTAKLKRMKKKQLRFIQKRDTNKDVAANK